MLEWQLNESELITAVSTSGLALFAALQIILEILRRKETRSAAAIQARGPAWLARRALEQIARRVSGYGDDVIGWAHAAQRHTPLESLEANMLEALRLASIAGGPLAYAAGSAFDSYLAFVDRLNQITSYELSGVGFLGTREPTKDDEKYISSLFTETIGYLIAAANHLTIIAPRQMHEPALPTFHQRRAIESS